MRRHAPCAFLLAALLAVGLAPGPGAPLGRPAAAWADEPAPAATPPLEDLLGALASEDASTRLAGFEAARTRQEEALLAPLLRAAKGDDPLVRLAAVRALGARTEKDARKKASSALAARLAPLGKAAGDGAAADEEEHFAVVDALHDLAQEAAIEPLLDDLTVHTPREVVRRRLRAVANVPSLRAIEALIDFGSRGRNAGSGGQRELAREALVYATGGVRFGDMDGWHVWWSENRKTFDVEAAARARADARAKEAARKAAREKREKERAERRGKGGRKDGAEGPGDGDKGEGEKEEPEGEEGGSGGERPPS